MYLNGGCFSIFSRSSMAERSPVKRLVPGSSPGGRALNPSSSTWTEQAATNRQVTGSNPVRGTGVITCCGLLPMFCPYGLVGLGYRLLTAEVTGSNPVGGAVEPLIWWFDFIDRSVGLFVSILSGLSTCSDTASFYTSVGWGLFADGIIFW